MTFESIKQMENPLTALLEAPSFVVEDFAVICLIPRNCYEPILRDSSCLCLTADSQSVYGALTNTAEDVEAFL